MTLRAERDERDPFERAAMADVRPIASRELTDGAALWRSKQLAALADAQEFRVALLHGVTAAARRRFTCGWPIACAAPGARCCCMVPEIALTPSVAALFRGTFGDRVAIQHSALSDGERHDQWHRIRRGEVDIVVGTRSAVFAPLDRVSAW